MTEVRSRTRKSPVEFAPPPEAPMRAGPNPGSKHSRYIFSPFDEKVYGAAIEDTRELLEILRNTKREGFRTLMRHMRVETRLWLFYVVCSGRFKYSRSFTLDCVNAVSYSALKEDVEALALPHLVANSIIDGEGDRKLFNELDQWTPDSWRLAAKKAFDP